MFTYPTRLPRHCTPARAIPSSQRRHAAPRHFSPRITNPHPRPRLFSDSASQYAYDSSSASPSPDRFAYLEDIIRPLCAVTPQESADPEKAWETFLEVAASEDVVLPRRLKPPLLKFATRLIDGAFTIACDNPSTPAEEMLLRAAQVRKVLEAITDSSFPPRQELSTLITRCTALEGRLEEVEAVIDKFSQSDHTFENALNATPVVQISRTMVQVVDALRGPEAAYDWMVSRWGVLERYLWTRSTLVYSRASRVAIAAFRNTILQIVDETKDPENFLTERITSRPDGPWKNVGEHLIDALCALRVPEDALDVMRRMERLSVPPSFNFKLLLIKALAKNRNFETAHRLYGQVCGDTEGARPKDLREVWSTGLYLHAMRGDPESAREDFIRLEQRGWVNFETIMLMLHATAVKGLVEETIKTFARFFPRGRPSEFKYGQPERTHYTEVLFALAQAGEMDRAHVWLKRMADDGITPDDYTYAVLLKGFAVSGDNHSLKRLLKRMKSSGVKPSLPGYTTVISHLARAGDSVGAERTYTQAIKDGIKPDIKMLNTLMFAHVQSRHWQGVVDTFNYIKSLPGKRYRPSTDTYNILLKAHVVLGTPFSIISDLVADQETLGTRPDAYTFALLIQSACDHQEFDLALGLLDRMDRLASRKGSGVEVTVYVLTILIGGFLRAGDKVRAKRMFEQMKSRNIVPTAITYSKIIHTYAREGTSENLQLAEAFMRNLISEGLEDEGVRAGWISNSGGRALALETLYRPLVHVYAKLERVEDVERLQQELLDRGNRPSLAALTALLAAYRNSGDVEAGKETWSLIFDMASQHSTLGDILPNDETDSNDGQGPISRPNILCVPLSIYIDLLSSAGHHVEVAKVWDELRTHGFTFDSHNWNHLIIALVRAGEPERAFAVLDRVLLPNAAPVSSARETEYGRTGPQPDSPLSIVGGRNEASLPATDESPVEPHAWQESTVHDYIRRMEGVRRISEHLEYHPTTDVGPPGDFAHRLETLQLIPFTWNSWNPHSATLSALSQALARLASGRSLRPIRGDSGVADTQTKQSAPTHDSAKDVLNRIFGNYPGAVRAVKEFDREKKERATGSAENVGEQSIRWR